MERLGLGRRLCWCFLCSSGAGGVLELGTGTAFLVAAGRLGEWVVHGTFLMNVYLVPQMKESLHARFAEGVLGRELDLGGEKEVGDCLGVHHSCEGCVALGGTVDGQGDGSVGWVEPDGFELGFLQLWVGCSEVVEYKSGRGVLNDTGYAEAGLGGVSDGHELVGFELGFGERVVMGERGVFGGPVWPYIDDGPGERAVAPIFGHRISHLGGLEDLGDGARSSPCDDVLGTSSCGVELGLGGWNVYFHPVSHGESRWDSVLV